MKLSNRSEASEDLIQIGTIVGAHGIRGVVKACSYADSEESFGLQRSLVLIHPDGRRVPYEVLRFQTHKRVVRLTLKGIDSRDRAEALTGCGVFVSRENLPALEKDTFYWADLIGLAVDTTEGEHLGTLTGIIPTGANDVYVIESKPCGEILVPAIASVVIEINLDQRRMKVELPEGLR